MEPVGRAWVDGMHRRHDWQAIDFEPLIIFTAYIGNTDSRLRANSIDWCIANARFASAFRLRNLALAASPSLRSSSVAGTRTAATGSARRRKVRNSSVDPAVSGSLRLHAQRAQNARNSPSFGPIDNS